jgi:DNA polymerase delta subunit 2
MPDQPTPPGGGEGGDQAGEEGEWVALVSGLEMGNANQVADVRAEMLSEWLLGEAGDEEVRWTVLPSPALRI